VSGLQNIL